MKKVNEQEEDLSHSDLANIWKIINKYKEILKMSRAFFHLIRYFDMKIMVINLTKVLDTEIQPTYSFMKNFLNKKIS